MANPQYVTISKRIIGRLSVDDKDAVFWDRASRDSAPSVPSGLRNHVFSYMPRPVRLIRPSFDHARDYLPEICSGLLAPPVLWARRESSVNCSGRVAKTAVQSIIAPRGPRFNAPAPE